MRIGPTDPDAIVPDMSLAPAAPSDLPAPTVAGAAPRDDKRRVNLLVLCGLALIVGIMTGCGAVALLWRSESSVYFKSHAGRR